VLIKLFCIGLTAETLRAKIDWKSAFCNRVGQYPPYFTQKGTCPTNHFCTDRYANEFLTTLSLTVHTKKLFSRLSSAKCHFTWKTAVLRFWDPFRGLGATYDVHLRLIEKRVVDLLLVLIKFFARCYRWCATSRYRLKIGYFAPTGASWPKISGRRGRPHRPFFFSEN